MRFQLLILAFLCMCMISVGLHPHWAHSLHQAVMQDTCSGRAATKSQIHHCGFVATCTMTMKVVAIRRSVVQVIRMVWLVQSKLGSLLAGLHQQGRELLITQ